MKKLLLCLMVGVMSLTSCELSDPDGLADPMKWSTVPSGLKNGELKVEAEGGSDTVSLSVSERSFKKTGPVPLDKSREVCSFR